MIHYDKLIKAEKMGYFSDYETMLFARAKGKIKSVTGVLPLTFTAKGGTAVDWVIYGNDDVGENLFDYSQGCDWASGSNGASYQKIIAKQGDVFTVTSSSALYTLVRGYDANDAIISGSAWSTGGTSTYTAPASIAYVKVVFRNFEYSTITAEQKATINETMLVKGSTAPDHYIPYQQGVGERTVNKLQLTGYSQTFAGVKFTFDSSKGTVTAKGQATSLVVFKIGRITFLQGTYRVQGCPSGGSYGSYRIDVRTNETTLYQNTADYGDGAVFTVDTDNTTLDFNIRLTQNVDYDLTFYPLVKSGSSAIDFIPYGYQIPLIVSQTGQTDKTYDIYIGDSPLTGGETVSKTSTGVDIELFEGENVVSTTLYNKPEMKIDYEQKKDADKNE